MRFFISTILKFTTHFQTSSSSRIHQSKAKLRQYFVFSNTRQRHFLPRVPGARARGPLKVSLQKEQTFAGLCCKLVRALAKNKFATLQIWLLRGLKEVRGEVCNTSASTPWLMQEQEYLKPVLPTQACCVS